MNIGDIFRGRYLILSLAGRGTASTVYKAIDKQHGDELVAIKVLDSKQPNEYTQEIFRRETTSLRRLNHPNVVRLIESGFDEGESSFYIVLEYLPRTFADVASTHRTGVTLKKKLQEKAIRAE